jgi:hypothetical protein
MITTKKTKPSQVPVIPATQEDQGLKPAQGNSSQDLISKKKNPSQKMAGGVAQGEGPEFKSQHCKNKQKPSQVGCL